MRMIDRNDIPIEDIRRPCLLARSMMRPRIAQARAFHKNFAAARRPHRTPRYRCDPFWGAGEDLRYLLLLKRKAPLRKLIGRRRSRLLYLDHVESNGSGFFALENDALVLWDPPFGKKVDAFDLRNGGCSGSSGGTSSPAAVVNCIVSRGSSGSKQ
jgi:hypothetical protein